MGRFDWGRFGYGTFTEGDVLTGYLQKAGGIYRKLPKSTESYQKLPEYWKLKYIEV